MKAIPVHRDDLDAYLPLIKWHLNQFSANGQWTAQDLTDQIRDRKAQLWIAWDDGVKAAVLTDISADRLKTCQITHAAGEGMDDWLSLFGVIQAWAKAQGCKRIEATARPGWEKVLRGYGLKKTHVVLEVRI